jgi:segregation and condensation protein A
MINVKIESYEGPLELLYELVEKNKFDIYDIPVSLLADQYLEAIGGMADRDMNSMSEFILMGAHLLEIKSRMLLPKAKPDGEDIDPRFELAERLAEYRRFKQAAITLRELGEYGGLEYYKSAESEMAEFAAVDAPTAIQAALQGITVGQIYKAFLETLARRELTADKVRGGFGSIQRDAYTVTEKVVWLSKLVKERKVVRFAELFDGAADKAEIIVTFLALLELMRQNILHAAQETEFGEIIITIGG